MLRGLFIGIDRYNPPVNRLSCARADAAALGSLFEDTMGGDITMLLDGDATRSAIIDTLKAFQAADEDDLIIISFAGHGTKDHRLVPVDIDPQNIANTCVSLEELATLLDAMPAKQMFVFLDCCFSGGFGGARVFAPNAQRGDITEDRSSIEELAQGTGRVVVTASGAGEESLETAAMGHGIFTYYLLEALRGPADLVNNGRISLLDAFNYVMQHVVDKAEIMQETQTPTLYGSILGAPTIAILSPGIKYATYFPTEVHNPVTEDWQSLTEYGIPKNILAMWSHVMPSINPLQMSSINDHGVLKGNSLLVVAPTGAGKTMVGELAAFRAVTSGLRAVLLLPLKALVNDKYEYFTSTYGDEVVVVQATGDNGDQVGAIISGQYDIALLTYEKFMNLTLGFSHIMRGVAVVVVDEVQNIADPSRGPSLEFMLTLLRSGHARGEAAQIVALSAVIGDTNGFERWIGGDLLRTEKRPIPLKESVIDRSGGAKTLNPDGQEEYDANFILPEIVDGSQSSKPWVIPLVKRLVDENKKVIVFRSRKGATVGAAQYLANALNLAPATETIAALPQGDSSTASDVLKNVLQHGVGFHNSDLDPDERTALEQTFRKSNSALRVLVSTTTLAMGVNTPAEAVVIAGLMHPFPQNTPYSVAEYKNMAGRAGRMGHTEAGEAYIIATDAISPDSAWQHYIKGHPEAVESHFLSRDTDPKTLALRCLVALGSSVSEQELLELLENSFAVWCRKQAGYGGWDTTDLARDLSILIDAGLLDREPNGNLTLTTLGRYAGESGIEVESVTRVSSALRSAPQTISVGDLIALAQVTCELDRLYIPANARSTQEQQRWPSLLLQSGVNRGIMNMLHVGGTNSFMATKRAAACLLFITDSSIATIERELLQHHKDSSAAGAIRQVANRTRDVIEAVARIAEYNGRTLADASMAEDLGVQLEYGIPRELVALARLAGKLLSRAQYLGLKRLGVTEPEHLITADIATLNSILGKDVAQQLIITYKKQKVANRS